jgi:hypothetical protein
MERRHAGFYSPTVLPGAEMDRFVLAPHPSAFNALYGSTARTAPPG